MVDLEVRPIPEVRTKLEVVTKRPLLEALFGGGMLGSFIGAVAAATVTMVRGPDLNLSVIVIGGCAVITTGAFVFGNKIHNRLQTIRDHKLSY